ncbi:hypothetical protein PWT90_00458 [Aphanocladium album]|nr:hypothetical protein PWT90_00458 [Aphanocladium album]
MTKSILITGATGIQGRAPIERLSHAAPDACLLGLTRNATSAASCQLAEKYPSLKLISGNLNNPTAVFRASASSIWAVYSVSPAIVSPFNPAEEERQDKELIDAAIEHGVQHFVLSSVDHHGEQSDDNETDVPHFQSKFRLEKYLQQQASSAQRRGCLFTFTILRLQCLMENLSQCFTGRVAATAWKLALHPAKKMQLIAATDIARYLDQALHGGKHANQSISIAGDELTFDDADRLYFKQFGRNLPTTYGLSVRLLLYWINELGLMMRWFNDVGCAADISELRKVDAQLMDFEIFQPGRSYGVDAFLGSDLTTLTTSLPTSPPESTLTKTTATSSTITTLVNGITTLIPTQPGMVDNCNKFHHIYKGYAYDQITSYNGISQEDFAR